MANQFANLESRAQVRMSKSVTNDSAALAQALVQEHGVRVVGGVVGFMLGVQTIWIAPWMYLAAVVAVGAGSSEKIYQYAKSKGWLTMPTKTTK